MSYTISGGTASGSPAGAGATVSYSGPSKGSVVSSGNGSYTISGLANGTYLITPTLANYMFTPASQLVVISGVSVSGISFVPMSTGGKYSVPDCRKTPNQTATVQGTIQYTVQVSSNTKVPTTDSRKAKPVASGTYPQNSRNQLKY